MGRARTASENPPLRCRSAHRFANRSALACARLRHLVMFVPRQFRLAAVFCNCCLYFGDAFRRPRPRARVAMILATRETPASSTSNCRGLAWRAPSRLFSTSWFLHNPFLRKDSITRARVLRSKTRFGARVQDAPARRARVLLRKFELAHDARARV
jgi:hypothetical protein